MPAVRTIHFFDTDGPLLGPHTDFRIPHDLVNAMAELLMIGDIVVFNTGRSGNSIAELGMVPIFNALVKRRHVDQRIFQRVFGYGEKGLVFLDTAAAREWQARPVSERHLPLGNIEYATSRGLLVPAEIRNGLRFLAHHENYRHLIRFWDEKQVIVTIDRLPGCSNETWAAFWTQGDGKPNLTWYANLLKGVAFNNAGRDPGVRVVLTSYAVDVEPLAAGKHIGVARGFEHMAKILKPSELKTFTRARAYGDSPDDHTMAAELARLVAQGVILDATYIDVHGNRMDEYPGLNTVVLPEGSLTDGTLEYLNAEIALSRRAGEALAPQALLPEVPGS